MFQRIFIGVSFFYCSFSNKTILREKRRRNNLGRVNIDEEEVIMHERVPIHKRRFERPIRPGYEDRKMTTEKFYEKYGNYCIDILGGLIH